MAPLIYKRSWRANARLRGSVRLPIPVPIPAENILRCTRIYSATDEFCKGILADEELVLYDGKGKGMRVDTAQLKYLTVQKEPLLLRDKVYLTFFSGATEVLYNRSALLTVGCLDGTFRKIALNRVRHIVF